MPSKSKTKYVLGFLFLLVVLYGFIGTDAKEDIKATQKKYCHMVELHMADPSCGWPDYNGNYNEICK